MSKYILETEFDYDFTVFAISSHEADYKMCIHLNKALQINLSNDIPIELSTKQVKGPLKFSCFTYLDDEEQLEFNLLANKSMNSVFASTQTQNNLSLFEDAADVQGLLLPELPQSNFFLLLKSESHEAMEENILQKIKSISSVLSVQALNPNSLNSKKNLII